MNRTPYDVAILVSRIAGKCKNFARSIHATRLSGSVVSRSVIQEIRAHGMDLDPEVILDKVRILLEEDSIELR